MSIPAKSEEPRHSCSLTQAPASRAKQFTSIAATTSWGFKNDTGTLPVRRLQLPQSKVTQPRLAVPRRCQTSLSPSTALRHPVALEDESRLEALAKETHIELKPPKPEQEAAGAKNCVFLDGADVTREIRTPEVAQAASRLATIAKVREVLVAEQQRAGAGGGVVMEGRDIGTVVFPKAELKIFLDASPEVRAERRWKEHQEKG